MLFTEQLNQAADASYSIPHASFLISVPLKVELYYFSGRKQEEPGAVVERAALFLHLRESP